MTVIHEGLRASTHNEHRALEALPLMRRITGPAPSLSDYVDYLSRQWLLHQAIESELKRWVAPEWVESRLVKSGWLSQDLAQMGVSPQQTAIAWTKPLDRWEALGAMYVLEGATLGVRSVARSVLRGVAHSDANRFMEGYGDLTGAYWREFLGQLAEVPNTESGALARGAHAVFAAYIAIFSMPHHEPSAL